MQEIMKSMVATDPTEASQEDLKTRVNRALRMKLQPAALMTGNLLEGCLITKLGRATSTYPHCPRSIVDN